MVGIGYREGLSSLRRSSAVAAVVLTFSAVMFLVADLERTSRRLLELSQQATVDLRNSLDETRR
jgi:hypothetical protein